MHTWKLGASPSNSGLAAAIARHSAQLLAALLLFTPLIANAQSTDHWVGTESDSVPRTKTVSTQVEPAVAPESTPVALAGPYESMVGDDDGFGYGYGWIPPSSGCETFDNRGPADLGVFDQRQPSSAHDSICSFSGSWTHTFTPPPGGAATLGISLHILGGQGSVAYCWASPCGCVTPQQKIFINDVEYPFFSDPGCAHTDTWGMGWSGAAAGALAASGSLNVRVEWGGNGFAIDYAKVTMQPAIEVEVYDGNGQRGVVGNRVEKQLAVKLSSPDTSQSVAGMAVAFEIIATPSRAAGQAVGADDKSTATTYSATSDANGIARATLVLGDKPGTYSVRVKAPRSLTGATADFTATAIKPATVAILKDAPDPTNKASAYAVRSDASTAFFLAGFDAQGLMIGPVKATWSLDTTVRGDVLPKPNTISTVFTPTGPGHVVLTSDPVVAGVSTIKADLFITKLYVSVQNNFVPSAPVDDSAKFIPGMYLDGTNVALDVMKATGQFISLHVLTGTVKGTATFTVDSTSYPGIAMNYPLNGDSTKDMQFANGANGVQTISKNLDTVSGDTWVTLLIRDFAASGTIRVSIVSGTGKTPPTYPLPPLRLPVDADGNGLPDAGWTAIGSVAVASTGLTATGDDDPAAGAVGTDAQVTGDGLSSFEEFRGFMVAGGYVRLNPRQKEIFVDIDPQFLLGSAPSSPVPLLSSLDAHILYLEPTEVSGQDDPSSNLQRIKGVVDFNRATVPTAHAKPQRAVRLVYQDVLPPGYHLAAENIDVPVWQVGYLGVTLSDYVVNTQLLNAIGNVATLESPMLTQVSEMFPRTFTNLAVNTTFSYPYHYDVDGNVVPRCAYQGERNCDYWDEPNHLIIPSAQAGGKWGVLYTVPSPEHDPVEHYSLQARRCQDDTQIIGGLTTIEMERLKGFIAAHEMGHSMHMSHLTSFINDCGDLMFDTEAPPPHRQTMSMYLPQPTNYSGKDAAMMRLWQQ